MPSSAMHTSSSASRSISITRRLAAIQPSVEPLTSTSSMTAMSRRPRRSRWYRRCASGRPARKSAWLSTQACRSNLVAVELLAHPRALRAQQFEAAPDLAQHGAALGQGLVHPLLRPRRGGAQQHGRAGFAVGTCCASPIRDNGAVRHRRLARRPAPSVPMRRAGRPTAAPLSAWPACRPGAPRAARTARRQTPRRPWRRRGRSGAACPSDPPPVRAAAPSAPWTGLASLRRPRRRPAGAHSGGAPAARCAQRWPCHRRRAASSAPGAAAAGALRNSPAPAIGQHQAPALCSDRHAQHLVQRLGLAEHLGRAGGQAQAGRYRGRPRCRTPGWQPARRPAPHAPGVPAAARAGRTQPAAARWRNASARKAASGAAMPGSRRASSSSAARASSSR